MLKFLYGCKKLMFQQEKMIDEIPKKAKIGSIETIDLLTHSALARRYSLLLRLWPPASIPRKSWLYIFFPR